MITSSCNSRALLLKEGSALCAFPLVCKMSVNVHTMSWIGELTSVRKCNHCYTVLDLITCSVAKQMLLVGKGGRRVARGKR